MQNCVLQMYERYHNFLIRKCVHLNYMQAGPLPCLIFCKILFVHQLEALIYVG